MDERIKPVLMELKEELAALYEGRLKGVYLFGSYARAEADEESDVDVLVVLDQVDDYSDEILWTSEVVARLSLKHRRSLSRVFVSEKQWQEDQTNFFLNVREEAIPA